MQIIDSHHHIWRQADLTWLSGPMQPRIFGPYEAIRRDYPIGEFLDDVANTGVVQSVYVQANWPADNAEGEVAYVEQAAAETGWPQAIVAWCDLTVADARPALDRLARHPSVRGIRQQFHWHENPLYRFADNPSLARDPNVVRNIGYLADYGFSFDLQVFAGQMRGAADLAADCPGVTFILQHAGMPEDLLPEGLAFWGAELRHLATRPNVVSKLSGLGTFIHRNDPAHIAGIVAQTVAAFGADRCLFGSNFPIEKLWTDYRSLIGAYLDATASLPARDREAVFNGTARRVYRLAEGSDF